MHSYNLTCIYIDFWNLVPSSDHRSVHGVAGRLQHLAMVHNQPAVLDGELHNVASRRLTTGPLNHGARLMGISAPKPWGKLIYRRWFVITELGQGL